MCVSEIAGAMIVWTIRPTIVSRAPGERRGNWPKGRSRYSVDLALAPSSPAAVISGRWMREEVKDGDGVAAECVLVGRAFQNPQRPSRSVLFLKPPCDVPLGPLRHSQRRCRRAATGGKPFGGTLEREESWESPPFSPCCSYCRL